MIQAATKYLQIVALSCRIIIILLAILLVPYGATAKYGYDYFRNAKASSF